jgi:hypothetical protein
MLVVTDVLYEPLRRWWTDHAFTTSIVGGLLVLAVTVLVVDQTLRVRESRSRAQATAAQAAILLNQAGRTSAAVLAATGSDSSRDAASDEARSYMTMVLIAAPVLIDDPVPRAFLEQAQWLGVLFSRALNVTDREPDTSAVSEAFEVLRATAAPLLSMLSHSERQAVGANEQPV